MMEEVSVRLQRMAWPATALRWSSRHRPFAVLAAPGGAAVSADAERTAVTVIQDGRVREFSLPRNASTLLDAALEQGLELPLLLQGRRPAPPAAAR